MLRSCVLFVVICALVLARYSPPEQDHYKVLGVSTRAQVPEIRKKYKQLAKQYHPDKNPGNKEAEHMFVKVNEAHETLTDPQKRREYDQLRSGSGHSQHFHRGHNQQFDNFDQFFHAHFEAQQHRRRHHMHAHQSHPLTAAIPSLFLPGMLAAMAIFYLFNKQDDEDDRSTHKTRSNSTNSPSPAPAPAPVPLPPLVQAALRHAPALYEAKIASRIVRQPGQRLVLLFPCNSWEDDSDPKGDPSTRTVAHRQARLRWRLMHRLATAFRHDRMHFCWADLRTSDASDGGWGEFVRKYLPSDGLADAMQGRALVVLASKGRKLAHFTWAEKVGASAGSASFDGEVDAYEQEHERLHSWLSRVAEGSLSMDVLPENLQKMLPA